MLASDRTKDRQHIKLHMTLMNSKFASDPNAIANPRLGDQSYRKSSEHVKSFSAKKLFQVRPVLTIKIY